MSLTSQPNRVCSDCGKWFYRKQPGPKRCWTCYWQNRPEANEARKADARNVRNLARATGFTSDQLHFNSPDLTK